MSSAIELWLTHEASVFSLEVARIAGVLLAGPLAWNSLPIRSRAAFVLALAFLIHGPQGAVDLSKASTLDFFISIACELGLGVGIGFVARLVLGVGEIAADAIAPVMGLGAAQMFDPNIGGQSSILTRIMRYMGTWVALMVGLHHLLLGAVFKSFALIPTGSHLNPGNIFPQILGLTSAMLTTGVKLALPMLAILFIAQVGLAFVARAAPAMQIFSIGFAVTLGIGFLLWVVFAPDLVRELSSLYGWAEAAIVTSLRLQQEAL